MGTPFKFEGATDHYGPPKGKEEEIGHLHVFKNGQAVVSAWRLNDDELRQINETGVVFLSVLTGDVVVPCYVGSERSVAAVVADTGKVWRK